MFGITDLMAYVLTVLIALLNPKGLVFFPAVMIQFVATETTSPMISLLVLGMIFQCCSLMFLLSLTKCSGLIGQKLNQFAWLNRIGQAGAGLIFLGFAARLAMASWLTKYMAVSKYWLILLNLSEQKFGFVL